MGRPGELKIPSRMPRLTAGLSLKLSFDPHFVSLPSRVAPAGLAAGEWDVPLQSFLGGYAEGSLHWDMQVFPAFPVDLLWQRVSCAGILH